MNAPTTAAQLAPAVLKVLKVGDLIHSTTHVQEMRRKRFDPVKLQELADSIKKVGVLQPIVARAGGEGKYQIVAGERRWLASKLAGMPTIPANVIDCAGDVLLEIQLIENLQREGLHEMEEAEGYAELLKLRRDDKLTPDDVAAMVGKSRSYVYARLKLLQLGREARDKFYAGEIDASRALEISRIQDPERQQQALALATAVNSYSNKLQYSVRELRERLSVDGHVVFLKHAPFPVGDPTLLPAAGSCTACPNRSGNATTRENTEDDPDVCTVVECYHRKVAAESDRKRTTLKAKGKPPIKGDDAKKYARGRKGNYVGHVDLDQPCEQFYFPEPEPKMADDVDDPDSDPAYAAWQERENAWKPPTYRQVLEGAKLETIHVEDHRTKRVHELAALKDVKPLLKKKGIDLPSYIGVKPSAVHRSTPPAKPKNETPEAKTKREAKEKADAAEREIQSKIEAEMNDRYPKALFQAARKNYPAKLDRTALQLIAAAQLAGIEDYDTICEAQGWKKIGWMNEDAALKKVSTLTEAKLVPLIFDCMLQRACDDGYQGDEDLETAVKTFKVNAATIKKTLEAEIRAKHAPKVTAVTGGKTAAQAWPFPTKSRPSETPAKKKTAKKASGKAKKK